MITMIELSLRFGFCPSYGRRNDMFRRAFGHGADPPGETSRPQPRTTRVAALARAPLADPMRPALEDGDLVALTLRGNPDAFATLVERYDRAVYHWRTARSTTSKRPATRPKRHFSRPTVAAHLPAGLQILDVDLCHRLPRLLRPFEPPQAL